MKKVIGTFKYFHSGGILKVKRAMIFNNIDHKESFLKMGLLKYNSSEILRCISLYKIRKTINLDEFVIEFIYSQVIICEKDSPFVSFQSNMYNQHIEKANEIILLLCI